MSAVVASIAAVAANHAPAAATLDDEVVLHPDAALLAAGERFRAAVLNYKTFQADVDRRVRQFEKFCRRVPSVAQQNAKRIKLRLSDSDDGGPMDRMIERIDAIANEIFETPAYTVQGMFVKADVLQSGSCFGPCSYEIEPGDAVSVFLNEFRRLCGVGDCTLAEAKAASFKKIVG